ncbi:MAG: DUF222 domain-containing protein [Microbacteriaceae bacterium]
MTSASQQIREAATRVANSLAEHEEPPTDVATSLPGLVSRFNNDDLTAFLADVASLRAEADAMLAAGAGVVAKRSERALGYAGLAARSGHRSAAGLLQSITGSTRTEAWRQVHLGEAMTESDAAVQLLEATPDVNLAPESSEPGEEPMAPAKIVPWFEPITRAVTEHLINPEGASALLRGLGQPTESCDAEHLRQAALELLSDAAGAHADDLGKRARWLRDSIDPVGVSERAQRHFDDRKARLGRNGAGARTVWLECDDESAAWFDTIVSTGMRPRRGGPRFVDKAEAERAEAMKNDPRTNEQLVFDLLMGTLRAGALADPKTVFGSRQAGVRVVAMKDELRKRDADGNLTGTAFLEETGEAIAPAMLEHLLCDTGTVQVTVDADGNPLDVGREQRLFTAKQRVALAIRDGGCMDPNCDRPPSYSEAHHIDHWVEHHGETNTADGILLCRFHHMLLHNEHWRIRRNGSEYWLHPPKGDPRAPILLRSKGAWWRNAHTLAHAKAS